MLDGAPVDDPPVGLAPEEAPDESPLDDPVGLAPVEEPPVSPLDEPVGLAPVEEPVEGPLDDPPDGVWRNLSPSS